MTLSASHISKIIGVCAWEGQLLTSGRCGSFEDCALKRLCIPEVVVEEEWQGEEGEEEEEEEEEEEKEEAAAEEKEAIRNKIYLY